VYQKELANLAYRTQGITKIEKKQNENIKTDEQINSVLGLEPWDQSDRQKQTIVEQVEEKIYMLADDYENKLGHSLSNSLYSPKPSMSGCDVCGVSRHSQAPYEGQWASYMITQ